MEKIEWYAECSLVGENRVYSIGTLAQAVRRWMRLSDEEKAVAYVQFGDAEGKPARLEMGQIAALAASPELKYV